MNILDPSSLDNIIIVFVWSQYDGGNIEQWKTFQNKNGLSIPVYLKGLLKEGWKSSRAKRYVGTWMKGLLIYNSIGRAHTSEQT